MLPAHKHVADVAEPVAPRPKAAGEIASLGAQVQWAPSPARSMQNQLAHRLSPEFDDLGRPSPLARLAIILGASAALWLMIGAMVLTAMA